MHIVFIALSQLSYTVLPLPQFSLTEILILSPIAISPSAPARINLPPLLTAPHGGPHATTTTEFSAMLACYALAGYRVAGVNYPGSTGFGQQFIDILPPLLGELEVNASVAVAHYLNTLSLASRTKGKNLFAGGSHSGYIGALAATHETTHFDAMLLRNPVIDLVQLTSCSDIPDWTYTETTLPYSFGSPQQALSPSNFTHLYQRSPLSHAQSVTTPTMLHIGDGDRRVPPDQGRAWFHALKSNIARQQVRSKEASASGQEIDLEEKEVGEVQMMMFPGNGHALSSTVEAEIVGFESGLTFLAKYTHF